MDPLNTGVFLKVAYAQDFQIVIKPMNLLETPYIQLYALVCDEHHLFLDFVVRYEWYMLAL